VDGAQRLILGAGAWFAQADGGLRLEQGQRCPQLVGGIGDEPALGGDLPLDACEGLIESIGQRPKFRLHVCRAERSQQRGVAFHHLLAQRDQRRQAAMQAEQCQNGGCGDQQQLVTERLEP